MLINRIRAMTVALLACTMLLAAMSATAATLAEVKARGTLSVSLYKDFPPFSYVSEGRQRGIDVELAQAIANKIGVDSSIRLVGFDENVEDDLRNNVWKGHYIGGGVTDIMLHMPYDRQFMQMVEQISFVGPYQLEQLSFAFDTKVVGDAPTLASFMSAPIGSEIDTLSEFYLLEAMQGRISKNFKQFNNLTLATAALKKGEIAAIMGPKSELEGLLVDRPEHLRIQNLVTPGLARSTWALGVAVSAEFPDLAEAVDKAVAELVKDGSVAAIFKSYGVSYQPPAEAPAQTARQP